MKKDKGRSEAHRVLIRRHWPELNEHEVVEVEREMQVLANLVIDAHFEQSGDQDQVDMPDES